MKYWNITILKKIMHIIYLLLVIIILFKIVNYKQNRKLNNIKKFKNIWKMDKKNKLKSEKLF